MTDYELGQRVTYSRTLHRTYRDGKKFWESYDWADRFPGNPELNGGGIVVGLRTLSDGTVRYSEEGTEYSATNSFQAVMIAHSLRRKPVFVRPEHVTPEDLAEQHTAALAAQSDFFRDNEREDARGDD